MGYHRHHAIVVTSWDIGLLQEAHDKAASLSCAVSEIVHGKVNGFSSFFVAPDGSKEDWGESAVGDASRNGFVTWLDSKRHSDGSSSLVWCELIVGEDDGPAKILRDSGRKA